MREHPFSSHGFPYALVECTGLHPLDMPGRPIRYVDDILGIKFKDHPLSVIQDSLPHMYGVSLQEEGQGDWWVSLEGHITVMPP